MQHSLARAAAVAAAVVVVAWQDSCSAATALSIGVPVFPVDGPSGSIAIDLISRARGDGGGGGSGGSGGSGGGRSWSLASAVVCVVMGAIGKLFPTKKLFMGASFSNRCHHTAVYGRSFLPTLT